MCLEFWVHIKYQRVVFINRMCDHNIDSTGTDRNRGYYDMAEYTWGDPRDYEDISGTDLLGDSCGGTV